MDGPWTDEEINFERWEADFGKPSDEGEHDAWLDWMEIEFEWGNPVPSC